METRILTREDLPSAKKLWGYAFETDEPFYTWYFDEVFNPQNALGIFIENRLISYLQLVPYTLRVRNHDFPAAYIVGVVTEPAYRSKGLMQTLLPKAIEEMRARNQSISILMPFETTFYRPYGWELCYSQVVYEVPIHNLSQQHKKTGNYTPVDLQNDRDIEALQQVYGKFLENYNGYVQRTKQGWKWILKDLECAGGHAYLLWDEQNRPAGYILYSIKENTVRAIEIGYVNLSAKKSLLGFMTNHRSQAVKASWPAPLKDKTYLFLKDMIQPGPVNLVQIRPFMCGRVICVKDALEGCRFPESIRAHFSIQIEDPHAPWNHQCFDVQIQEGKCTVEPAGEKTPDLSCSINGFSQIFFGALSIEEAMESEVITLHRPDKLQTLHAVFEPQDNFINEYF